MTLMTGPGWWALGLAAVLILGPLIARALDRWPRPRQ